MIADRFGADSREAKVVVGFVEGCTAKADCRQPIERLRQLDLISHRQHDEMTTVIGLKAAARLQTGMTDLHDLIRQGQIGANQRVAIANRGLLIGHGG
jgi:hypothetical protein